MSFTTNYQRFSDPTPPERGSFPLDHAGDCKHILTKYMKCLKESRNNNADCRQLSKEYLVCRMEHNLMAKDELKNLGFQDEDAATTTTTTTADSTNTKNIPR